MTNLEAQMREIMIALKFGYVSVDCATAQAVQLTKDVSLQDNLGMFGAIETQNRLIAGMFGIGDTVKLA